MKQGQSYGGSRLYEQLTEQFLKAVSDKFHYEKKDLGLLRSVARDMRICLKGQEVFFFLPVEEKKGIVILTLGGGVDLLCERYMGQGRLMEAYMLENMSSELLLLGYDRVNEWVEQKTGLFVSAVHFWGSEEQYPIGQLREILQKSGQNKVICTKDCCLRPDKSVVYQVEFSAEKRKGSMELCENCSRRALCGQAAGGLCAE